jgi:toxin YhaV
LRRRSTATWPSDTVLIVNGWKVGAHPLFTGQLLKLVEAVEREKAAKPKHYRSSANAKLLAAILKLILDVIPSDPTTSAFRQGDTLGANRKHWFRAKFGAGRFRLFFRFSSSAKTILYAWVNDEDTLRTYGSKTDAYRTFEKMLNAGNPPDSWDALSAAASKPDALRRLSEAIGKSNDI